MARLIEINSGAPQERKAQEYLRDNLPDDWIITTNIDERNFLGISDQAELDSVLLAGGRIFIIDFKMHRGRITPSQNGKWQRNGAILEEKNPFDQQRKQKFALKKLLQTRVGKDDIWIDAITVFTAAEVKIDWSASNVESKELQLRAVMLNEVQSSVAKILARTRRKKLEWAATTEEIISALKPSDVGDSESAEARPSNADGDSEDRVTLLKYPGGERASIQMQHGYEHGIVRQTFSHGRSKTVLVETKKSKRPRAEVKKNISEVKVRSARQSLGLPDEESGSAKPTPLRSPEAIAKEVYRLLRVALDGASLSVQQDGSGVLRKSPKSNRPRKRGK
jgi:hypothetical protein